MVGSGYTLTNERTGDRMPVDGNLLRKLGTGGPWMRVFTDTVQYLIVHHKLHGQTNRILFYAVAAVHYGNEVPSTGETAEALGINRTTVSRAYRELVQSEFLIKKKARYYLSPLVGWCGTEAGLKEAYRELFDVRHSGDV